MGLAPYGEPKFAGLILERLIDLKEDGTFRLDQAYFDYCTGLTMTNERFDALFGHPARKPEELLTQFQMDVAASIQAVTEEVILRLARSPAIRSSPPLPQRADCGDVKVRARHAQLYGGRWLASKRMDRLYEGLMNRLAVTAALVAQRTSIGSTPDPDAIRTMRQRRCCGGPPGRDAWFGRTMSI
jgi:hypothetical protein